MRTNGARSPSACDLSRFLVAGEDGDAFCERFRWLRVETPAEFQRITAQSFAMFANQFLEQRQFAGQHFVAAFPLEACTQKIEIVLTPQDFAQDLGIMSHLFQNRSVQWLQNSQLIPDILHALAPRMKVFRVRIINRSRKCALAPPVNFTYRVANLFPIQAVKWPRHQTYLHIFQLWDRF